MFVYSYICYFKTVQTYFSNDLMNLEKEYIFLY